MVKRKSTFTKISIDSLEKIAKLKKNSGLTSAEIIDNVLKTYGKETDTPDKDELSNMSEKRLRAKFMKSIHDSPSYLKLDNTKPPTSVLDACILSLWGKRAIEQLEENVPNPDYENYLVSRKSIIQWVKAQLIKPIDGISWSEFHKTWWKTRNTYKGKFEITINNRIKALMRAKILKYSEERGQYIATRDLSDDENIIIEGILRLQPQKGIVIPTII